MLLISNMNVRLLFTIVLTFGSTFGKKSEPCTTPNGENATCISINTCEVILNAAATGNQKAVDFAQNSQCDYDKGLKQAFVCCGSSAYPTNYVFQLNNNIFTEKSVQPLASEVILSNFDIPGLSDKSLCGLHAEPRIKGGTIAGLEEFPWVAAIEYRSKLDGKNVGIICGGSVITDSCILTAAHCITHIEFEPIKVWLGVSNVSANGTSNCLSVGGTVECGDAAQKFDIAKKVYHQFYNRGKGFNDIGLLVLDRKITFNNYIRPICLPSPYLPFPTNGTRMMVAGWGVMDNIGRTSDVKLKLEVPVVPNSVCNEKFKNLFKSISSVQICAGGEPGKDSCQGDSGGPLMRLHADKSSQPQWYAEGVVSYGSGCGVRGRPGIYTRVSRFVQWISSTISQTEVE